MSFGKILCVPEVVLPMLFIKEIEQFWPFWLKAGIKGQHLLAFV